jgi:hypothetical protein
MRFWSAILLLSLGLVSYDLFVDRGAEPARGQVTAAEDGTGFPPPPVPEDGTGFPPPKP